MSDDISSSPTWVERPAASRSSSPSRQPLRRRITYVFMPTSWIDSAILRRSGAARYKHVFEVLAGATTCAPVDVAAMAAVEPKPGVLEDLRIEVTPVVDDDE